MKKNIHNPIRVDQLTAQQKVISVIIIAVLFFVFGFVTWVNAILIPYFKIAFDLSNFDSYLVAFAFYIAYLVMAIPSGYILKYFGFKAGMMLGFFMMAIGAFLFIPAGAYRIYGVFLTGLFTLGVGLSVLQTAANPYVTILGDKERAAQRFSIMGISNKVAGIIAPLLFAAIILKPEDKSFFENLSVLPLVQKEAALDELVGRVVVPYMVIGFILIALGLLVKYSPLPEIDSDKEIDEQRDNSSKKSVLSFPYLVLGSIAIFFHVGSQVIAVDSVITYAQHYGLNFIEAKSFPSYTLTTTILGYLLGITFIPKVITQLFALRLCTCLGLIFSLAVIYASGNVSFLSHTTDVSVWFLVALGFANSMIWAGVWPLALNNLGKFLKIGASLLVMALCGNAIMPMIYGYFADTYGLQLAYWVLIPCYVYLVFYAFYGYNIKSWKI
jgi:FHS family L-fucose permease-like MFS transporter